MNVRLEKRFSHGYTVVGNYTFSKFLEATNLLNAGDAAPSKVISDQDFPHHISVTAIYELPFGRGRKYLASARGFLDVLVSGWQLSPIYTYQSGPPVAFGNVILAGDIHYIPLSKDKRSIYQWFNTSLFNRDNAQQLASNLRTLSQRFGGIRADAYNYWDLSALKNTRIHETMMLEFRLRR